MISALTGTISLLDRLATEWKRWKTRAIRSVPGRFVELFESHGVHRSQIPRFFGHNITLGDLADDSQLLSKLTEPVLDAACALFAIRREWLDGVGETPYFCHEFYKSPENFDRFLGELKTANPEGRLAGYLFAADDGATGAPAVLVLEESVGAVGDTIIYRYHLCDDWVFGYWKSRGYLTACVAIAWKRGVFIRGRSVAARELGELAEGEALVAPLVNRLASRGRRWDAEDFALLPDQYLSGLDPEQNQFGVISALRLWLQLDEEGWMETGLNKKVRPAFESELMKYEPA